MKTKPGRCACCGGPADKHCVDNSGQTYLGCSSGCTISALAFVNATLGPSKVEQLQAQLTEAARRAEVAELECKAWRALNDFESDPASYNKVTNATELSEGEAPTRFGMRGARCKERTAPAEYFYGEGPTPQAAAIDLATKLGIIGGGSV